MFTLPFSIQSSTFRPISAIYWEVLKLRGNLLRNINVNPSLPDPEQRERINLNFYFHAFLWCLKRFHEEKFIFNFLNCTWREGLILMFKLAIQVADCMKYLFRK